MAAHQPLALVGIGCRFPGNVRNPDDYWQLLMQQRSGITEIPAERWDWNRFYHSNPEVPGRMVSRWGGFVEQHHQFDASFFNISPREASHMDLQQRWLLQETWMAFEDAGIVPNHLRGANVGVYIGISSREDVDVRKNHRFLISAHTNTGSAFSIAANRISYVFDLKGPSLAVDTACSSALVALDLACQSLWSGQNQMALVGGVNCLMNPETTIGFSKASMLSPTGQCYAFDSRANGYVRSEGAAIVVLQPLHDALSQGRRVYAIIRSTATNQDGHTSSLTVPSMHSQITMLRDAYQKANVDPHDVRYIEAHGTGTPVGDPIETRALGTVLGQGRHESNLCWLGSAKANIGHLEPASGMAGLIKTALVLHHKQVPPQLNFETPNPHIPWSDLGLSVVREAQPLYVSEDQPVVAGVNSFGFGGTNAHAVLEAAPLRPSFPSQTTSQRPFLLCLSSKSEEGLKATAETYKNFLEHSSSNVEDIVHTAAVHRQHHSWRTAILGRNREELVGQLGNLLENKVTLPNIVQGQVKSGWTQPIFVFTGQGAQWWGMGQQLLQKEPLFREQVERIDALMSSLVSYSLLEEMQRSEEDSLIHQTDIAQPAIFALQVGLVALWKSWGLIPKAVIGHSVGEVAASYTAGIYSLEDAVRIIVHRSRLQHTTAGKGAMLAVGLPEHEVHPLLQNSEHPLQIAAFNSPNLLTLGGEKAIVDRWVERFQQEGIFVRKLRVQYAFHTDFMDPIREELLEALHDIQPKEPTTPMLSTVSGSWMSANEMNASYWWRNVREPVHFSQGVQALIQSGSTSFVEIGPHPALQHPIKETLAHLDAEGQYVHSLKRFTQEDAMLLSNLAACHAMGQTVSWDSVQPTTGSVTSIPTYHWQQDVFRLEPDHRKTPDLTPLEHPLLGVRLPHAHPTWESELDPRVVSFLRDHMVWDSLVFPAAGYMEMGLALAQACFPEEDCAVERLHIHKAMFLPPQQTLSLQTTWNEELKEFHIYSRGSRNNPWELHASGRLQPVSSLQPSPLLSQSIGGVRFSQSDLEPYYNKFSEFGLKFGSSFRLVQHMEHTENLAMLVVSDSSKVLTEPNEYHFHPALLDNCFHGILLTAAQQIQEKVQERLYLPASVRRFRMFSPSLPEQLYVHTKLCSYTEEELTADLKVYDNDGHPVAEVLGFVLASTQSFDVLQQQVERSLYQPTWVEEALQPASSSAPDDITPTPTTALFLSNNSPFDNDILSCLRLMHEHVVVLPYEEHHDTQTPKRNGNGFPLDVGLDECLQQLRTSSTHPLTHIVHGWSLGDPNSEELDDITLQASQHRGVQTLLFLAQALEQEPVNQEVTVSVLTHQAHVVVENDALNHLAATPMQGFVRVARNECTKTVWSSLDLPKDSPDTLMNQLKAEWLINPVKTDVAFRDGCRFVQRIKPLSLSNMPKQTLTAQHSREGLPYKLYTPNPGPLDSLRLEETQRRRPQDNEVEVWVKAGGINFRDVMKVLGVYPGTREDRESLGDDFSGVVVSVGKHVTNFKIGDAVVGMSPACFRSHVNVPQEAIFRKPDSISYTEAATLPTVYLTAYYGICTLARMRKGESILIHSATGGVGQAAIQIAKDLGLTIFATAGTPEKRDLLRSQGVTHIYNSRTLDFADAIMEDTQGRGVDAVLNSLAGDYIPKNISILAPFGRYLELGKIDIYNNSFLGMEGLKHNISFFVIDLSEVFEHRKAEFVDIVETLQGKFHSGEYKPLPSKEFAIHESVEAFRYMAGGQHIGKNVLSMEVDNIKVYPSREPGHRFPPSRTYLVTGGTSGLGFTVASWLAKEGVTHLMLMSRRGVTSDEVQQQIEQLRKQGISVDIVCGDVTNFQDVNHAVQKAEQCGAPLGGVFHSAMVLDDTLLNEVTQAQWENVVAPKMLGAWNLHQATQDVPLEHFVCFSSISSLLGMAKQANYNAGNSFLDGLASFRRTLGLPALTVNWGVLSETGFVARNQNVSEYLERAGLEGLTTPMVLKALEELLPGNLPQAVVHPGTWDMVNRFLPGTKASQLFDWVLQQEENPKGSSWKDAWLAAPADERGPMLETWMSTVIAEVLGMKDAEILPEQPLSELGLDSMMGIELMNTLNSRLQIKVSVSDVLRNFTLRGVSQTVMERILSSGSSAQSSTDSGKSMDKNVGELLDLQHEMKLESKYLPSSSCLPVQNPAKSIFLTGSTGFLGAFLVAELLTQTQASLVCLVRASSEQKAFERVQSNLQQFHLWRPDWSERIQVLCGDLSKPNLGLTQEQWESLAHSVDSIIHNGAALNLIQPYSHLRAVNVESTGELIRLGLTHQCKPLHYVSSIVAAAPILHDNETVLAEEVSPGAAHLPNGYALTKWISEHWLQQAHQNGLPCTIYRPSIVTGHSKTGLTTPNDLTALFLQGCHALGHFPEQSVPVNIVPVDVASQSIVALSQNPKAAGEVFHITHPHTLYLDAVAQQAAELGEHLEPVPFSQWLQTLENQQNEGTFNPLHPMLPLFSEATPEQFSPKVLSHNATSYHPHLSEAMPTLSSLLNTYAHHYLHSDWLLKKTDTK